jgi:hypothetical protein
LARLVAAGAYGVLEVIQFFRRVVAFGRWWGGPRYGRYGLGTRRFSRDVFGDGSDEAVGFVGDEFLN